MAVSDREFAELHADVKHLCDEFDEFRIEVRNRLDAGQVKFQRQAEAEAELRGMKRVAQWVGYAVIGTAGAIGSYLLTWAFEWLKHR